MKEQTADLRVATMPAPQTLYVPLSQHIGKPAVAVVSPGQRVKAGEIIGQADGAISSNVY